MKTLRTLLGLGLVLGLAGAASANVLPADATSVREVKVFRNVSGATTQSHTAFILQNANSDTNVLIGADDGRESSLGLDVTTTTSADVESFVGCQVDTTCVDDGLCRVVTWGPAICLWNGDDNTDTRLAAVGTSTLAGQLGTGTNAGLLLSLTLQPETNDAEINGDGPEEWRWIWVRPGAD